MDLLMREVAFQDSEEILAWRNQSEVREFSRNQDLITKETHSQWLNQRLKLIPAQPFWMFESGSGKVGFVRFDLDSAVKLYEISIVVNPAMRGKGFGKEILNRAINKCLSKNSDSNFIAEAHKNNLGSHSLFLNCGFQEIAINGNFLVFKRLANHN